MANVKKALENIAEQQRNTFIVKQRRQRQRRLATELLVDYAEHSTLHGLRYVTEKGAGSLQVAFWLLTFVASVLLCGYYISNVFVKWTTSPVIVSIDEKLVSAGDVPFPSITICPQVKSRATVYNLTKETILLNAVTSSPAGTGRINMEQLSYELAKYEDVATLCRQTFHRFLKMFVKSPKNFNSTVTKNIYYEISPSIENTIRKCKWHGHDCKGYFSKVITEEGICFNFNSVSAEELFRNSSALAINITESNFSTVGWNSETGYSDSEPYPYPVPGNENSAKPDLRLTLVTDYDDKDILCNYQFSGYKIYLHSPVDLPQSSLYYYAAVDDQVTSLAVDVSIMKTPKSLIHYKPEVRQCYFPGEKYLRFFKIYTAKNCQLECLTNETLKRCHCIGLNMPHYNASTEICKRDQLYCMEHVQEEIADYRKNTIIYKAREEIPDYLKNDIIYEIISKQKPINCGCLPLCNDIQYDAHIMKTNYNVSSEHNYAMDVLITEMVVASHRTQGIPFKPAPDKIRSPQLKYSELNIFFKKPLFTTMRRSELFGWTDFVANVGGLLGLFLGFSVLSLIEIVYYLTVKIFIALKRDSEDNL